MAITPELFIQMLVPLINSAYSKKKYLIVINSTKQVTKWILAINLPVAMFLILFSKEIINILFGESYLNNYLTFEFLIIGGLISSIGTVFQQLLAMKGKSKTILLNILLATILNVFLNYMLIPKASIFGVDNSTGNLGASLATMLSIIFLNILLLLESKYFCSIIPLRRKMINIAIAALLNTILFFYIKPFFPSDSINGLMLGGSVYIILYLSILILFKGLDRYDLNIFNEAMQLKILKQ
jgi:O-antigen/teichoic acid export membrane protein